MADYPVEIVRKSNAEFLATWADFPAVPGVTGTTPEAAFHNLIDRSFSSVADLIARGQCPPPSPANGRPTVKFGEAAVLSPHIGRLVNLTSKGTWMLNYAWTNDSAYLE